ncbi:hypothetical protein FD754_013704 [Muntiacus muntjak]|uniref:Protein FAM92A1 n=1 Tax=Muntiacus muntjak TaxID=9888 RepID=A0A5N3VHR3_MUNMU|nr:hypothetical protein FD754_013704 [Muntiacus muntjak]
MLRCSLENQDTQTRQLQDAVTNVEKHFGELCQIFAVYVQKTARLRDKADRLTLHLEQGLKNFADEFVKRLEAEVIEPLKAYGTIAETELQRATMDVTRITRHLEEITDNFEKQKIKDIKTVFSEFITIEMLLHRKALEVYTAAYQNIQKIVEEDLEVLTCPLRKDQQIEDDDKEDEDLDAIEDKN